MGLQCLLIVRLFVVAFIAEFELWRHTLGQVDLDLVVARAQGQARLRPKDVVLLLLLVHLLDVDLHELIRLNGLAYCHLALASGRLVSILWVQDLIVELDLVLESSAATIQASDALFLISVNGNFRFL